MKQSFLLKIKEWVAGFSSKPWACFETPGASSDGILEFSMAWNDAFVNLLRNQGYTGMSEEEIVQLFFLSTRVLPENLVTDLQDDDTVNPAEMPRLSSEANILRK